VGDEETASVLLDFFRSLKDEALRHRLDEVFRQRNDQGLAPIHLLAIHAQRKVVEKLLATGIDVNYLDGEGWTPLHHALAAQNHGAYREILMMRANVHLVAKNDELPVHFAAGSLLYHRGVLLDKAEHEHFESDLDMRSLRSICRATATVNAKTAAEEWTALHFAAARGDEAAVSVLMSYGCSLDIDRFDKWGDSVFHTALRHGHVDLAQYLLENGVPTDLKSRVDSTCDELMEELQQEREEKIDSHYEKLRSRGLGLFGMSPQGKKEKARERRELVMGGKCKDTGGGNTALHLLASIQIGSEEGKELEKIYTSKTGAFPPHIIYSQALLEEAIDLLTVDGADVNAYNAIGFTPLMIAAQHNNMVAAVRLIENDALVTVRSKNKERKTALDIARDNGFDKLVDVMKKVAEAVDKDFEDPSLERPFVDDEYRAPKSIEDAFDMSTVHRRRESSEGMGRGEGEREGKVHTEHADEEEEEEEEEEEDPYFARRRQRERAEAMENNFDGTEEEKDDAATAASVFGGALGGDVFAILRNAEATGAEKTEAFAGG